MRGRLSPQGTADDLDAHGKAYDLRLLLRLWRFIRPHAWLLVGSLVMIPIASALSLLQPFLLKLAIDQAIVPRALNRLGPIGLGLVLSVLAERLARYGETFLLQVCGQRAMHELRVAASHHLLALHSRFFDRAPVGQLISRVTNDVESITDAFSQGIVSMVADLLTMAGILVVMLWLNARLALVTLCVVPLLLVVVFVFRRLMRGAQRLIRERVAEINAVTQESLTGMALVQIFGRERETRERFDQANAGHRDAYIAAMRYDAGLYALVEMLASLAVAVLLWYGGVRAIDGAVTFGLLVAFIEYVERFFIPIRDMSVKYMAMQQAMAASERVFRLLDQPDLDGAPATASPLASHATAPSTDVHPAATHAAAAVELCDVSFGYQPATPVIQDVSFTVTPGERVAIVGATGAGKSTIAKLITRLYEPTAGAIRVRGRSVHTYPLAELRRDVVVVNQDVFLFAGTVLDNITLGDPKIDPTRAENAADQVGLSARLPLATVVAPRGANLSAGERQLVVFARAIARKPEILVLDEATASVDPTTEAAVEAGIAELMRGRTAMIIAHRLTTVEQADRIIVLAAGRIVETGTHHQLLAQGGAYKQLYELQQVD